MRILLRHCTAQFLPFAPGDFEEVDDAELGVLVEMEALGLYMGAMSFPRLLGVLERDQLTDWGVLCLPVLSGVL